jgi:Raf kinase inhibitor-like YbhB/YbcL family protein
MEAQMTHSTMLEFAPALMLIALASCGASNHSTNQAAGGGTVENATLTKLSLTSDAFHNGQAIPAQFTCDGANQSPAMSWGEPPQGTKSFALIVDDPEAPGGTFHHWGAYDIPATARAVAAGQRIESEATNDFGKTGYGGPCPPKGHGVHHYRFRLYALDVERLGVGAGARIADVEIAANQHAIGKAELVGTYERK